MSDKLFLIAIGGTGMRCLESFVHLCAAGMFDNDTIEVLTIDTDQSNGNKGKVETLINLYNKVKTNDENSIGGEARTNTFFSAKLNIYRFFTDYSKTERRTLAQLSRQSGANRSQAEENTDLMDLFFDRETVQEFQLDHGYRAQTHLGSLLMYHGIVEAARKAKTGGNDVPPQDMELKKFLELLSKNSANARVFVFGSIFGGTGASSIPVLPTALHDAINILAGGKSVINFSKVKFGSTLLTDYFSFGTPTQDQLDEEKVIADSHNFALNSQAALKFYNSDPTVKNTYKYLYHIGWPIYLKADYSTQGKVTTGGADQKNACHMAELMCAAAAYDFFTLSASALQSPQVKYVYRTVEETDNETLRYTGSSFVGSQNGELLENKLGALLSLAFTILSTYGGFEEGVVGTNMLIDNLSALGITDYNEVSQDQAREIDEYMKEFAYKVKSDEFVPGWIYQIKKSAKNGAFLFRSEAFPENVKEAKKVDPGNIFVDENHNWVATGGLFGPKKSPQKSFDVLAKKMQDPNSAPYEEQGTTLKERFLAHIYNAITMVQNFQL